MTSALSAAEPGVMPAAASSLVVYAIVRSALNTPASIRWSVTKNGRTPGVPTVIAGPGGTSASAAPGVAPRIERPAVTRVATAFVTKSTTTSGVGSGPASAPPWSTVRAKKVAVDAPAGTSRFSIGLKFSAPVNVNVPGGPPATMSANQARTASRMPALGTRMPRSSVGKPLPVSRKSSTCANSGTKVTVPGAVPTLAAWVAGPFWSSAAVAAPLAALAWSVPGVV